MARGESLIRQWNLLKVLQAYHYGVAVDELCERLECSRRQMQRDLNVLRQAGFPITYDERDFGKRFWKLSPRFIERGELILSVTEMLSLYLCRQLLAPLAGTQFGEGLQAALDKIKALLPASSLSHFDKLSDAILVTNTPFHDYSQQSKEIGIINRAVSEGRVLRICYAPPKRESFEATFHPYGIVLHGAALYCVGRLIRGSTAAIRKLKVSRFVGAELTDRSFVRPEGFSLESCMAGGFGIYTAGSLQTVRLRFTGWAATSVSEQQWHPSQRIITKADNSLVAEFRLGNSPEFRRWVLGFGRNAVVLQPKSLADEIAEELAAARAAYAPAEPSRKTAD